jgi:DNA-binding CsgD family transcriptional regulator
MLKELIKSLNATKAHVEELETKVEKRLKKALATIHADHGFDSVKSFIRAVKKASKEAESKGVKAAKRTLSRTKRGKITATVRAAVKKMVKAGRTGAEIAKNLEISTASVQNIKKALGLVRKTKKASQKAKSTRRAPAMAKVAKKKRKKRGASKRGVRGSPEAALVPTEASVPSNT